jgi:NAD(P)-dependent dehydrogenase (short-subunit alcohol dehydrogenase family)
MGVNFWSVVHGIRAFVPGMIAHGEEGHVVNTASIVGMLPAANWMGIYAASKHAVVSLSEYLYRSLQSVDANIGASVLCPSFVSTNLGTSARNRPETLRDGADVPRQRDPAEIAPYEEAMANRISAYDAGGIVLDAIRNDRFWIQTDHLLDGLIRDRFEGMLDGKNPWE